MLKMPFGRALIQSYQRLQNFWMGTLGVCFGGEANFLGFLFFIIIGQDFDNWFDLLIRHFFFRSSGVFTLQPPPV